MFSDLFEFPSIIEVSCHSPEPLWQQSVVGGSTRRYGIEQLERSIRYIDGELVAVTNKSLNGHVQALKTGAGDFSSCPGDKFFGCQAWRVPAFPRQHPKEISEAVGRYPGMKQDTPDIFGTRIIFLLEGRQSEPAKVVEERVAPCGLKAWVWEDIDYCNQLRPEGGPLVVLGSDACCCQHMHRGITPEQPLSCSAGTQPILQQTECS
ncbi:hypothetical protein AO501_09100 [Mycobacterium gordonae]|uniref:Uncharacterized protein n=1 Tax=Mycobacterium gordonae TaxID=1778 RepID=A0A0Q2MHU0_MYCGO|nr:hypothetical protein AO501_09100 [Mycobacterium gordonae]